MGMTLTGAIPQVGAGRVAGGLRVTSYRGPVDLTLELPRSVLLALWLADDGTDRSVAARRRAVRRRAAHRAAASRPRTSRCATT